MSCIIYSGLLDKDGYGREYNPRTKRQAPAHRLVWERHHNVVLPSSTVVRHKCDNPSCVNVDHLCTGTQADNMRDMVERGRLGKRKGASNPSAVLSDEDIAAIRSEYTGKRGELTALGKKYGVSRVSIANYIKGTYR